MEEIKSSRLAGFCVSAEVEEDKSLLKSWNKEKWGIIGIPKEEILDPLVFGSRSWGMWSCELHFLISLRSSLTPD